MKSLIKNSCACETKPKQKKVTRTKTVAQCCAKVSKAVAGCHD